MAMFDKSRKASAEAVYEKRVKPYLKEKDGFIHTIMINSFSKLSNQVFDCDQKYSIQIDEIITGIQVDGYDIVDIKFNSLQGQGMFKSHEGFHTLIMYK